MEEKERIIRETETILSSLGFKTVEADIRKEGSFSVLIVIHKEEGVNTDDIVRVHSLLYPRLSALLDDKNLSLSVSSPGVKRVFKDNKEFEIFKGKKARVYSSRFSSYITGIIERRDEKSVYLSSYTVENTKEEGEEIQLDLETVKKVMLAD